MHKMYRMIPTAFACDRFDRDLDFERGERDDLRFIMR